MPGAGAKALSGRAGQDTPGGPCPKRRTGRGGVRGPSSKVRGAYSLLNTALANQGKAA